MADIPKKPDNVTIEGARILFRNFAGREQTFNSAGDRNFHVIIPPEMVEKMQADGWNVKPLKVREEGEIPDYTVKVKVSYKGRPPRVVLISSKGRVELGQAEVEMLDFADIKNIDIVLNPYPWDVSGKQGITAYLKTAFVTIMEDELELKYAEEIGLSLVGDASIDLDYEQAA